MGNVAPFGEPLAHARRADAAGNEADGHVEFLHQRVAKQRHETAAPASRAGLRVVRDLPVRAVEGGDAARLRRLFLLAVVRRVRLPRDDEHLAHADVLDATGSEHLARVRHAHFEPPPTAGWRFEQAGNRTPSHLRVELLPRHVRLLAEEPRFDHRVARRVFRKLTGKPERALRRRGALHDLEITRRSQRQFRRTR